MSSKRTLGLGLIVCLLPSVSVACAPNQLCWAVYYSDRASPESFADYSLLVLDSDSHPPLGPLAKSGKTLLGYLSLAEIHDQRAYYRAVQREGILLGENSKWKGSFFVDVRSRYWERLVLQQLVPAILQQGFQGLFLDTLDDAAYLENLKPRTHRGMTAAAAHLVQAIRARYPTIPIMMNRAFELLPQVERDVHMVLAEGIYSEYDSAARAHRRVPYRLYREQVGLLKAAKIRHPELQVFTLDYWDPNDTRGMAKIYREQRANGFYPYVSTVGLNRVIPEPRS